MKKKKLNISYFLEEKPKINQIMSKGTRKLDNQLVSAFLFLFSACRQAENILTQCLNLCRQLCFLYKKINYKNIVVPRCRSPPLQSERLSNKNSDWRK